MVEAALQLHKESELVVSRDDTARLRVVHNEDALINFTGQGGYLKSYGELKAGQEKFDPPTMKGCSNCSDPSHVLKTCPKPLNVGKAAARKPEYFKKSELLTRSIWFWRIFPIK